MCVNLFYIHTWFCVQGAIEVTIYDRLRGPDGKSKVNHVGTTTLSVSEVPLLLLLPTPFSTPPTISPFPPPPNVSLSTLQLSFARPPARTCLLFDWGLSLSALSVCLSVCLSSVCPLHKRTQACRRILAGPYWRTLIDLYARMFIRVLIYLHTFTHLSGYAYRWHRAAAASDIMLLCHRIRAFMLSCLYFPPIYIISCFAYAYVSNLAPIYIIRCTFFRVLWSHGMKQATVFSWCAW
jgi:hypothetical protein